jgi:hypothetical protein
MALSEERKKKLAAQKRRALMKDIDKREAAQKEVPLMPYSGVNAKRALRIANKANIDGDYEALYASKREDTLDELNERIGNTMRGERRDLRNIEKYGDDAMKSRAFGSRKTKAKGGMVQKRYMEGGCVMPGRGVRNTNMS